MPGFRGGGGKMNKKPAATCEPFADPPIGLSQQVMGAVEPNLATRHNCCAAGLGVAKFFIKIGNYWGGMARVQLRRLIKRCRSAPMAYAAHRHSSVKSAAVRQRQTVLMQPFGVTVNRTSWRSHFTSDNVLYRRSLPAPPLFSTWSTIRHQARPSSSFPHRMGLSPTRHQARWPSSLPTR